MQLTKGCVSHVLMNGGYFALEQRPNGRFVVILTSGDVKGDSSLERSNDRCDHFDVCGSFVTCKKLCNEICKVV